MPGKQREGIRCTEFVDSGFLSFLESTHPNIGRIVRELAKAYRARAVEDSLDRLGAGMTGPQLWYVTQVYPEAVTKSEAARIYEKRLSEAGADMESVDQYWETAAGIVNDFLRTEIAESLLKEE